MAVDPGESFATSNNDNLHFKCNPKLSICSVEYNSQMGTGSFFGLQFPEDEGTWHTLFITSYRIVPINNPSEVNGLKLIFHSNSIGNVNITPDCVNFLLSSDELNVTVIALSATAIKILSREQVVRLRSATPREKERIYVFQSLSGEILQGAINKIYEKIIQYNVCEESELSLFGSPIFNVDLKVVGIVGGFKDQTDKQINKGCIAVNIIVIFDLIKKELTKRFGEKFENEMWLDQIRQIPTDNLIFIESGGYGKVYKTRESNGNILALKVVEGFGGLEAYERETRALQKEYALVTKLDIHPRIINFFAFVKDDQHARLIIVMEYLEGGNLQKRIDHCLEQNATLDKILILKYLLQILEGLEYLHQNSIYHSDIKPANILLTSEDLIKICDFGIAVQVKTDSSSQTSHLKGECYYMSPERIAGESRSAENDMWSIGATFVTMISGHTINHNDKSQFPQILVSISKYEIFIEETPLNKYLDRLVENDYRREIISRTLCTVNKRETAQQLLQTCKMLYSEEQTRGGMNLTPLVEPVRIQSSTSTIVYTPTSATAHPPPGIPPARPYPPLTSAFQTTARTTTTTGSPSSTRTKTSSVTANESAAVSVPANTLASKCPSPTKTLAGVSFII